MTLPVRRPAVILACAAGAALLVLIWPEVPVRSLEYDEIWTQQFYVLQDVGKTLTDLATPNNQLLHTLCCKGVEALLGESVTALRLTAFLAMAALFVLAGLWGKKRLPAGGGLFLVAVLGSSGGLIHYAGTARGYTLQCFFTLLMLASLLARPRAVKRSILVTVAAAGACLTISSGAIFAGALIGSYLFVMIPWRKEWFQNLWRERDIWLAPLLFVLLWYGSFYAQLRSAQQFGNRLSGFSEWLGFCRNTVMALGIAPLLLLAAAGCCVRGRYRRLTVMTLLAVFLALASTWVTKTGPVRVYLPLIPVAAAGAAMGTANLLLKIKAQKKAFYVYLVLALSAVACREQGMTVWNVPDAGLEATRLMETLPEGVFPVFAPNESLPVVVNQPEIRDFCGERLQNGRLQKLHFSGVPSGAMPPGMTPVRVLVKPDSNGEIELDMLRPGLSLQGRLLVAVSRHAGNPAAALQQLSGGRPWLVGNLWFGAMQGRAIYFLENAPGNAETYLAGAGDSFVFYCSR